MHARNLRIAVAVALALSGCSQTQQAQTALTPAVDPRNTVERTLSRTVVPSLTELDNLDYGSGTITVFHIQNGHASVYHSFAPSKSGAQGLAVDARGLIYTTITASNSNPCSACVEVFTPAGQLVARLAAPILPGAPNTPSLTDVALDAHDNIYVSDYGQQAIYFFPPPNGANTEPAIVVQNSQNAASVLSTPNGGTVFVSGGCGFASVRPFTRLGGGRYQPGSCFGIGTIALIGGGADDDLDVFTPVDGVPALVSVSSPTGGTIFHTPDQRFASISGVALTGDGSVAYVANHRTEGVYAFQRPANGWINGGQPKLLTTYKGFKNLDIIAVRP
jgi:hypothetical protein